MTKDANPQTPFTGNKKMFQSSFGFWRLYIPDESKKNLHMPVTEKSHTINGQYEGDGDAYIHFFHTDRKIQCFYLLKRVETFRIIFFHFLHKAMLTRVSFLTDLAGGSLRVQ